MCHYLNQARFCLIASIFISMGLISPVNAVSPGEIFVISNDSEEESYPAIHNDTLVWQTWFSQSGDFDITGADIHDLNQITIFDVAVSPDNEIFPDIWNNLVVYETNLGYPDWDIAYCLIESPTHLDPYNLLNLGEQLVLDSHRPRVCGTYVAWDDYYSSDGDWDVTLVDINNLDEPNIIPLPGITYDDEYYIDLDPNLVVWNSFTPDWGSSLSGASLWTEEPENFYSFMSLDPNSRPVVCGDWVVGCDPEGYVVADNLFDPLLPRPISNSNKTAAVAIADHIVVWQDLRNGTWDLYGYNLNTQTEFVIAIAPGDQVHPAIAACAQQPGYWVVWENYSTALDDGDIHGIWLNGTEVELTESSKEATP